MFTRQVSDPGTSRQESRIRDTSENVFRNECSASARTFHQHEDNVVNERRLSAGEVDSPPQVRHVRRKKHSFARMVEQKINLDIGMPNLTTTDETKHDNTYCTDPMHVPHIEVEACISQRPRSASFSMLRCRSDSDGSDYFTPKKVDKHDFDEDLRQVKTTRAPLLSAPSFDFLRRASETNMKDDIRRLGYSPTTCRKEVLITNSIATFPQFDKCHSDEEVLEVKDDVEVEGSPLHSFSDIGISRKQQRISLPFIKFSETESEVSDDNDVKARRTRRLSNRTRKHTFTHMTNLGIKSEMAASNKLIVPVQKSVIKELTSTSERCNLNDEIDPLRNSTGTLTHIGENSVKEYNLDYDLDTMRKKSCFVLTNRSHGETTANEPENLNECTNLVKAIEFAAFEINEAYLKKQKNRRASCPTKLAGDDTNGIEHNSKGEKRWRKKSSILGKLHMHRDYCDTNDDMKKILDEVKDSEIVISNIDRLVGRRGGVCEKCKIERELVKHAVKHLMKNAVLAQAL